MKCHHCGRKMEYIKSMKFNEHVIDGWKCACGEVYYHPEQAQKILALNKLKKEIFHATLGKIRSNLILRLPKDIEFALGLEKGEKVLLKIEGDKIEVIPA